jgi:hypothetical protein
MNDSNSDLRRERQEHEHEIRRLENLIRAHKLKLLEVQRRLREREETSRRLELRESV